MLADRIRMCSFKGKGTLIDRTTPTLVTNNPFSTEGNGGRKSVRLSNGTIVASARNVTDLYFYKSLDRGETFQSSLNFGMSGVNDWAIVNNKDYIFIIHAVDTNIIRVRTYRNNFTLINSVNISTNSTLIEKVSATINKEGTEIHICWSDKHSIYPSSFNIRYCKGIILSGGSVNWGSVEQVTTSDISDFTNTSITLKGSEELSILTLVYTPSSKSYQIRRYSKDINGWSILNYSSADTYVKSAPMHCRDINKKIILVWSQTTPIYPDTNYIHCYASGSKALVPGINPSLTINKNNTFYIEYQDGAYVKRIQSQDGGKTWSTPVILDVSSNPSTLYDNTFELDFEVPLSIRQTSNSVIFSGKWYE